MSPTTDGPSFKTSKQDALLIHQIVRRAVKLGHPGPALTLDMDLTAAHLNGCELDLPKLLAAPDLDFVHDTVEIQRHIYRLTGKLMDCFVPRCAKKTGGQ